MWLTTDEDVTIALEPRMRRERAVNITFHADSQIRRMASPGEHYVRDKRLRQAGPDEGDLSAGRFHCPDNLCRRDATAVMEPL